MAEPSRIAVRSENAPKPAPFLSSGLIVNGLVYCSGQTAQDPRTGKLVEGTIKDRTRQILSNLDAVLKAGGSSLQNAVKVNIFLTDMKDYAAMNEVYTEVFSKVEPKPIRTCVAVKALPLGTDVEIECSGLVAKSKL